MLRHIFERQDLLARLRVEVAPAFANTNSITTLDQLYFIVNSCPLLRAFYDETLRLHSPSSSNRRVEEDTIIGGYTLKAGHHVMCPSYAQHHNPEYFGQDPTTFDPDRFLKPVLAKGKPADAKMVRAFGGGVSLCSGRFYASHEALPYTATVLWRFDVEFKAGGKVRIVSRKRE